MRRDLQNGDRNEFLPEAAYASAGLLELRLVARDVLLLAELLDRRDDLVLPDGVLEALLERRALPATVKGPFTYDVRKQNLTRLRRSGLVGTVTRQGYKDKR